MQPRYSPTNQVLHWATTLCILAILPLAWVMTTADKNTPGLASLYNWHKTLGNIVLLLTILRLCWRLRDGPPPFPPSVAKWNQLLSWVTYRLFFLALLWMPVTGTLMSMFETHETKLFEVIPGCVTVHAG